MKISDIPKIWKHIHKAGRVLAETIHEYLHKFKMGKDFPGPNLYGQGHLFLLISNITYKKMEMTIKPIGGDELNKAQLSVQWNTMQP